MLQQPSDLAHQTLPERRLELYDLVPVISSTFFPKEQAFQMHV